VTCSWGSYKFLSCISEADRLTPASDLQRTIDRGSHELTFCPCRLQRASCFFFRLGLSRVRAEGTDVLSLPFAAPPRCQKRRVSNAQRPQRPLIDLFIHIRWPVTGGPPAGAAWGCGGPISDLRLATSRWISSAPGAPRMPIEAPPLWVLSHLPRSEGWDGDGPCEQQPLPQARRCTPRTARKQEKRNTSSHVVSDHGKAICHLRSQGWRHDIPTGPFLAS
jgi:hypothetical protein